LIVAGLAALTFAGLGLADDDNTPAAAPPTTQRRVTEAEATAFVSRLTEAINAKDDAYLLAHLDPVVTGLYGAAACSVSLRASEPRGAVTVTGTSDIGAYVWEVDGISVTVPDVWTVSVEDASQAPSSVYVGTRTGSPTWFSDCGTPLPENERDLDAAPPKRDTTQPSPTLHDSCRGVRHGESFKFRDAAGEPLTSPSVILSAFSFNTVENLTGAIVTLTLNAPDGATVRGTGVVDKDGRALVAVPISQHGTYTRNAISVFADSPVALVDHGWDAPLEVGDGNHGCDKDDVEVAKPGKRTNETAPDTGGLADWAYYLIAIAGLAAIAGGIRELRQRAELLA
jgi:hypothetical protein